MPSVASEHDNVQPRFNFLWILRDDQHRGVPLPSQIYRFLHLHLPLTQRHLMDLLGFNLAKEHIHHAKPDFVLLGVHKHPSYFQCWAFILRCRYMGSAINSIFDIDYAQLAGSEIFERDQDLLTTCI